MVDLRMPLLLGAMMALAFGAVLLGLRHSLAIEGAGVRRWAQGDLVGGAAMVLLGLHDRLPDALTVGAAEVLLVTGVALQHRAMRAFLGLAPRTRLELGAIAITALQSIAFGLAIDVPGARALVLAAVGVALYGGMAATVLSPPARRTAGAALIGLGVIALLALAVARTAIVIETLGPSAELLDWHPAQLPFYLAVPVFVALVNLGFVVMVDARRRGDLERLASVDPLTGLFNRRAVLTIADTALAQATRSGRPLALLMLDVDRFKALNDRYGHAAGDAALVRMARTAQSGIRAGDTLGRYGGEEFVAVLPDTSVDDAMAIAERVRSIVEREATRAGSPTMCTVSIGVATTTEPAATSLDALLARADAALYRAKQTRNAIAADVSDDAVAATAVRA